MRRSKYITVETINKHKTDGVVIGQIQKGKQAETLVSIYGKSENDVSKYIQSLSSELPLIAVTVVNPFEACGKSIVKAGLSITADQTQLSIPDNQNTTKISFDMDGNKFECNIQETSVVVVSPNKAPLYLITVDNIKALMPTRIAIASIKPTSTGAIIVAFASQNAAVSTFMRQMDQAGATSVTLLSLRPIAACGKRLSRIELEIKGDNSKLIATNFQNEQIEIAFDVNSEKFKCAVPVDQY